MSKLNVGDKVKINIDYLYGSKWKSITKDTKELLLDSRNEEFTVSYIRPSGGEYPISLSGIGLNFKEEELILVKSNESTEKPVGESTKVEQESINVEKELEKMVRDIDSKLPYIDIAKNAQLISELMSLKHSILMDLSRKYGK